MSERAERIRAHSSAETQSRRMVEIFVESQPEIFEIITSDFREGIAQWPGLELTILDEQGDGEGGCSVAGAYLWQQVPKIIGVAKASPARMRFTGLHELGHHIQRSNDELLEILLDRPDQGRTLEEAACDLFAARLLLPQQDIDAILGDSTPTALAVLQLWRGHSASRAAAAVAAVQKLSTDGHILILNGAGAVEFAASRGLPRIGRRSDQSQTEIGRNLLASQRDQLQGKTRFAYQILLQGEQLWYQAVHDGIDYWFVVAATASVPWEPIALPLLTEKAVQGYWWTCEMCGHVWESYAAKHQPCGTPVCPACDRCNCRTTALKVRMCEECFLEKSVNEFVGDSRVCVEH